MAPEELHQVVVITLGGKALAFPVETVREVVPLVEPTPVPAWPDTALGVIEIRGELVPLLDVTSVLDLAPSVLSAQQFIVVVEVLGKVWGIVVDRIEDVRHGAVRAVNDVGPAALNDATLCVGVITEGDDSIVVLDPEQVIRASGIAAAATTQVEPPR